MDFDGRRAMTEAERTETVERLRRKGEIARDVRGEPFWHALLHAFNSNNPVYRRCLICEQRTRQPKVP